MKMIHKLRRALWSLLVLLAAAALVLGLVYGCRGWALYQEALDQGSLEARISAIRQQESYTPYEELPEFYIQAVVSVEDRRFWRHGGIDPLAICRALWTDLRTLSPAEGGSTITQQLAKNLFFTQEKTLERKAAEVFAAFDLEAACTKEELFALYVNTAYFGSGYYGIGPAARGYFQKEPAQLTDYQSALLAGLPNAPSVYSPDVDPDLAHKRLTRVLQSMVRNKLLTADEQEKILAESAQ